MNHQPFNVLMDNGDWNTWISHQLKKLIQCNLFGEALKFNRLRQKFFRSKGHMNELANSITQERQIFTLLSIASNDDVDEQMKKLKAIADSNQPCNDNECLSARWIPFCILCGQVTHKTQTFM